LFARSPTAAAGLKGDGGVAPHRQYATKCPAAWTTTQRHT
jgi:hypothetical protein